MSGPLQELARAARRWPRLVEACKAPEKAQAEVWATTRAVLQRAPFWQARYGAAVPELEAFEVTTYDDYAEAIERSWATGVSELTGEPVAFWALSSGSSGKQKRFPWTDAFLAQHREGSDLTMPVFEAIARRKGRGPLLSLVATSARAHAPGGALTGYASNLLGPDANPVYPRDIDYSKEAFTSWMPLYAAAADLGGVRAVSCDHVFLLVDRLEAERERYLSLLSSGAAPAEGLPELQVHPDRLAYLRRLLSSSEPLTLGTVWPQLKVIHTWRAATAGLQAEKLLSTAAPGAQLVDFTYASSEGPIANPVDPDGVGGPIHPGSIVHEFVEVGSTPGPGDVLKAWELQPGRSYEVLLTTLMGLVRYRIGDVVRCTDTFHRTPVIRFEGRASREISLGVTTFSERELTAAMAGIPGPDARVRQVFGPAEDGRALVLYTTQRLPDAHIDAIHAYVREANDTYRGFQGEGRMARITQQELPADHPIWAATAPAHAQAKPVLLVERPPSGFLPSPG